MSLKPIAAGLRTIHNGSNDVAKAQIVVPMGDELTVSEYVAGQLQRDGAFKDGPAPQALVDQVAASNKEAADAAAAEAKAVEESFAPMDDSTDSEPKVDEQAVPDRAKKARIRSKK